MHFNIVSKSTKSKQQPWIVVKSLPSKKYAIKEGDMLRIGKQKVRVK
jgi:predicted HTH transcriptional regulator